ncbi:GNAT family N-acetyltransferase (plasmid) [Duffyella gerundensis]|uniref:GNAT family N-acetyltransferase n=1 Tax=Duffyella gerundensis TaxID=1619313 RepID=UPI001AEA7AE2|nr:GNAT family N-acetyltransferase [Duffyella gerundensis]QTO56174.1 GNAT family N-acetyltransferase [Duffyella gerundensis]
MNITYLTNHLPQLRQTACLMSAEWSALPLWASETEIVARLQARLAAQDHQFTLIAIDEQERVIATGSIIRYELEDVEQRRWWLGEVVTEAACRGKGIASALIGQCLAHCQAKGIATLWLYTPDQQAFYRKSGWQEIEQREVYGERVSVMSLSLSPQERAPGVIADE